MTLEENFDWMFRQQNLPGSDGNNFRPYVLNLPKSDPSRILGSIPSAWNVPPRGHLQAAQTIIQTCKPKTIVELGVDFGYSSLLMALESKEYGGKVTGIDCFEPDKHDTRMSEDYYFVMALRDKLELDNLEIVKDYFDNMAANWGTRNTPIDLLHIDGLHDYANCKNDYEKWSPFVEQADGIIIFHDTVSYHNDVGRLFSEIPLFKANLTNSNGLGVACYNRKVFIKLTEELKAKGIL